MSQYKNKNKKIYAIPLLTLLGASVCAVSAMAEGPSPAANQAAPAATNAHPLDNIALQGKVLETMNAGGYTYLQLDSQKGKVWVAIPETKVNVGEEVSSAPGMVMRDFASKTLKRNFESIVFSPGLGAVAATAKVATAEQAAQKQTGSSNFSDALAAEANSDASGTAHSGQAEEGPVMGQNSSPGSAGAVVPSAAVKVEKASGDNGYSVGEIFTQATALDGKTVRVRAKIVKNSRMIMGKNWLHLQDGSGDPAKNQHDLVATTTEEATEGDVVTVQGIVAADRDFGAGYHYQVLLENAKVEKQ